MTTPISLLESNLRSLELVARGKVRDIYRVDSERLLIIATDRISAFDVILPNPIPGKGITLTAISNFWFHKLQHMIPNHLTDTPPEDVVSDAGDRETVADRSVVVERLNPLPIEAVVRGYLIGSGWKDYVSSGKVSGIALPKGLELAEQLQTPLFTPSTKAAPGDHDVNISFREVRNRIGRELAERVAEVSLDLYSKARDYAQSRGIIIADTKFEFGISEAGELKLIDEVLTPDSSRFWPAESYERGSSPPSFDKQYVRDYLESLDWNKQAPGPELPAIVVQRTGEKYREALKRLTT
jgi:phosphoribosylaminoimidazole-succinocarboxamide synthase